MKMEMPAYAILKDKKVVMVRDVMDWAMSKVDRRVAKTYVGDVYISTVFLGMDHGFGGRPQWFETMVFGGTMDGEQQRYETYEDAEAGHLLMVNRVKEVK